MADQTERKYTTVSIKIEHRNGGFYISSDDVPGLWLWGRDPELLFNDLVPTIQELYKLNQGKIVDVEPINQPQTQSARLAGIENIPDHFKIIECVENQSNHVHG